MLSDDTPTMELDRKETVRQYLRMENAIDQYSRQHRPYYARLAREAGLTHQEIADEYGISEAAVRGLLKRAEGEARPS